MARSGLRWIVVDAFWRQVAIELINRRHGERGIQPNIVEIDRGTMYAVINGDRLIATATIISLNDGRLPCMDAFSTVYPYYVEQSMMLGRPARMVEIGALDTDVESGECIKFVMQQLGAEIIEKHVDHVFVDIHPRHRRFYETFWGMECFAPLDDEYIIHPKDKQSAVCMHYSLLADPRKWLRKLRQKGGADNEDVRHALYA